VLFAQSGTLLMRVGKLPAPGRRSGAGSGSGSCPRYPARQPRCFRRSRTCRA